jgi:hypothetical protein
MINKVFFAIVLCLGLTSCPGIPSTGEPETQIQPLVITESNNVKEEAIAAQTAVPIPIESLGGDVGDSLKAEFTKRGTQPMLTTAEHTLNTPGAMVVTLDANATKEILSPSTLSLITNVVGGVVPGSQPWMQLLLVLLPFLSSRFRKHTVTAVKRVVPGVQGPNQDGKIPDLDDIREMVHDLTKAVTFAPVESQDVITSKPSTKSSIIEG